MKFDNLHYEPIITTGDINNDGYDDLLEMYDVNQYLSIWINDGQGNLQPNDTIHTDFYFGHYAPNTSIGLCDADGDGHKELFVGRTGGEIKYYSIEFSSNTLVESYSEEKFFSPNPALDRITFSKPMRHVELYNMKGQKILEKSNPGSTLDISQINRGIYIIKSRTTEGKILFSKLVKL